MMLNSGNSCDIFIPVAPGELLDKLSILEIKKDNVTDQNKLQNIKYELELLEKTKANTLPDSPKLRDLYQDLKATNQKLWIIEDDIRHCERQKQFGDTFVELARAVYITNDQRCEIKRRINDYLGSKLIEEKSYQPY